MYVKKVIMGVALGASVFSISCQNKSKWDETNAFFHESELPYHTADFSTIQNKDFKPALLEGMRQQTVAIEQITSNPEQPTFTNTIEALELSGLLLTRVSNVFYLLTSAHTNDDLIAINNELAPKFATHTDEIYLNEVLFERVKKLYEERTSLGLTEEQIRLIDVYYERFLQAGANLKAEDKQQLKQLNQEIASLTNAFGDKLLAATKSGSVDFTKEELTGLSEEELVSLEHKKGKYSIPLNNTTQQPALSQLQQKESRSKLFQAAWIRAEKEDKNDTRSSILALTQKRAAKAKLLGFDTYAAWSLQGTMAQHPKDVFAMLAALSPYAMQALKEEAELLQEASQSSTPLTAADWTYYAEQVRRAKFALNQEELKPYFELEKVLKDGVFFMAKYLYGISFIERTDIPVWHEDVKVYEFFNQDGSQLGLFYTDYFQRDSKQGGAWMSNIVDQSHLTKQLPVIYNVANFPKPAAGQAALLSMDQVVTLFHEFGHALHGLFANQQYPTLSGTNVSRDFVEFPSQFHEHFAFDPVVLDNYAKHYQTGYVMPQAFAANIKAAAGFNKGYNLTELLGATIIDLAWHSIDANTVITDVDQFETDALKKYGIYTELAPPRYRSSYFSHIFGGGYAAGYYSYKWSEMLDFDAYAWLMENGGMSPENGDILRKKIFSRGNTIPLDKLYRDFRGKDPNMEAYLHYAGFTNN